LTIGTASSRHYLRVQIMHELVLWFSQVWETQLFTIWHFKAIPSATRRFPPMPSARKACYASKQYQIIYAREIAHVHAAPENPAGGEVNLAEDGDGQIWIWIWRRICRGINRSGDMHFVPSSVPLLLHIRLEREIVSSLSGSPSAAALGNAGSRSIGAVGVALWGVIVW